MTAVLCTCPLDVVRGRLTAQGGTTHVSAPPQYRGIVHCARTMAKEEGTLSLYRGFTPKIIGIFPYAGLNFGAFETLKDLAPSEEHLKPGSVFLLLCGAAAGTTGQTVGYPFDLVTRRFQMVRPDGGRVYSSVFRAFSSIVREEGVLGLYKGFPPNVRERIAAPHLPACCTTPLTPRFAVRESGAHHRPRVLHQRRDQGVSAHTVPAFDPRTILPFAPHDAL